MTPRRTLVALVAQIVLTLGVALLLSAAGQWLLAGDLASALSDSPRLLFVFMGVGLAIWIVALVVLAVRRRAVPGVGITLLWAFIGTVVNAVVVLVVGVLEGGWGALMVLFAIEAGIAFLVAVLVVAPIVRRLTRADVDAAAPERSRA